jgi:hypothetical protein
MAPDDPLLHVKRPKGARADNLLSVATSRRERRVANHRLGDRHRLINETVRLTWKGADHEVELINLSGGGAMVQATIQPLLWDAVTLYLGPNGTVDCTVCWRKGDRIGLQFVDETRLDYPAEEVAALLREVISRSFPEAEFELSAEPASKPEPAPDIEEGRRAARHPLIWKGILHHDYQSTDIRVRNISATGAMIESTTPVRVDTEPLLELSDKISISATVEWTVGDQVGLRFHHHFDLSLLAQARPALATSGWERPTYLGHSAPISVWDKRWTRQHLDELRDDLEGFMKR